MSTVQPEHKSDLITVQGKADAVTAALRELIITGELAPGTQLRQRDLAARFGVSSTPAREALRRLEAEGLVGHDLHRGVRVIEASLDSEEEGYRVRAALEALAARFAASRATATDLEELEVLHERLATLSPADPEAIELNRRLHFRIYEAARSPVLLALLRLLWQSFRPSVRDLLPRDEAAREHEEILEALRRGDEDGAERITREHVLRALERFLAGQRGSTERRMRWTAP